MNRHKILIADDSEMNRELLSEMLSEEFDIVEVENGAEALKVLQNHISELSLVLLDIVMPEMDGFEVLAYMNKYHWIADVPVIMISSENSPIYIQRAYEFGVADYISRPFDATVVYRRVMNTIMLYAKQRRLAGLVTDQIYEKEKSTNLMVSILSHIVEFRNGESGLHVLHINIMTELLLKQLMQKSNKYHLTQTDISLISTASALHDIGKISVPDEILNKPGRLTPEEFEIIKQHSMAGASMLEHLPLQQEEPLVKVAYAICRWHHERYDGRGYPDGLKGEKIPISAQVVAMADVYDALTSERCYKKAFSHDKAMEMILNGECGSFNPLLLECLQDVGDVLCKELQVNSLGYSSGRELRNVTEKLQRYEETSASERVLRQLECARMKYQFMLDASPDIIFMYNRSPAMFHLSELGVQRLGLSETTLEPRKNDKLQEVIGKENLEMLVELAGQSTPENPEFELECRMNIDQVSTWCRCICRVLWSAMEPSRNIGIMGRLLLLDKN